MGSGGLPARLPGGHALPAPALRNRPLPACLAGGALKIRSARLVAPLRMSRPVTRPPAASGWPGRRNVAESTPPTGSWPRLRCCLKDGMAAAWCRSPGITWIWSCPSARRVQARPGCTFRPHVPERIRAASAWIYANGADLKGVTVSVDPVRDSAGKVVAEAELRVAEYSLVKAGMSAAISWNRFLSVSGPPTRSTFRRGAATCC